VAPSMAAGFARVEARWCRWREARIRGPLYSLHE
jgi:hypothetical protein